MIKCHICNSNKNKIITDIHFNKDIYLVAKK